MHAIHKLNPDQLDEPLEGVEAANLSTEQHEAQAENEVAAAVNGHDSEGAADILSLDDVTLEPTQLPALAIPGNLEKLHARPSADIDDLDGLLSESLQIADDGKRMKDARKRAFGAGSGELSIADREKLRAEILRWELETEYVPQAVVGILREQQCACGKVNSYFYGLFVREYKKSDQKIDRLVRWIPQEIDASIQNLPRHYSVLHQQVPMCEQCMLFRDGAKVELDWEKLA
jgi:hypothetical protein